MKIIVVGGTGTIGKAVVAALKKSKHEVVVAGRTEGNVRLDITSRESIQQMYDNVGKFDALISAAGGAAWKPLHELGDKDYQLSLNYKLMGQINLFRYGIPRASDGASFTLTSGILAHSPAPGSAAASLVNAGLEGFVRAAALEAPRGIRINVVSPPSVSETLVAMGQDPKGGLPAEVVARAYVASIESDRNGETITPAA